METVIEMYERMLPGMGYDGLIKEREGVLANANAMPPIDPDVQERALALLNAEIAKRDHLSLVELCRVSDVDQLLRVRAGLLIAIEHGEVNTNPKFTYEQGVVAINAELTIRNSVIEAMESLNG